MAGFLDNLRMATGLSLSPQETYWRAFEKGVLLGPSGFADAAGMFQVAAERLVQVEPALAERAATNARLYRFLSSRDLAAADEAVVMLQRTAFIELPGTADETIEGKTLAVELRALALEQVARNIPVQNHHAIAQAYWRAAQAWRGLRRERLVLCEVLQLDSFIDEGITRFFYVAGLAEMNAGAAEVASDPDSAAEHFAMAAQAYARCGAQDMRRTAQQALHDVRFERSCWFCGRVVRGLGVNLTRLAVEKSPLFEARIHKDRAGDSYDPAGYIFSCNPCASAVDGIARVRVDEVRKEMQRALRQIESRLREVESKAHRHHP